MSSRGKVPKPLKDQRTQAHARAQILKDKRRIAQAHARAQLRTFALRVLEILEEQDDWSSETTALIDQAAQAYGLAKNDGTGHFCRTPRGRGEEDNPPIRPSIADEPEEA